MTTQGTINIGKVYIFVVFFPPNFETFGTIFSTFLSISSLLHNCIIIIEVIMSF